MRTLAAPKALLGGRYVVRECLGEGGWGAVYAATQRDLGRAVAIKVLHPDSTTSPDRLVRFEREARAAAALGHPNIVQVTDFQAPPDEPPFLVMEILNGATLAKTIELESKLTAERVAWIAHQVLSALDAAHAAGIVHRDVKPENIFLVSATGVKDFVKLLDFGIAKLAAEGEAHATTAGALLGSPAYMAPEQVRGEELDPRVDLYALGATMYRALSGKFPFDAPSVHALLFAITTRPLEPLCNVDPSVDPALAAIVERALSKNRDDRFASAAEMRAALEPWTARERGAARAPTSRVESTTPSGATPQRTEVLSIANAATLPVSGAPVAVAVARTLPEPLPLEAAPSTAIVPRTGGRAPLGLVAGAVLLALGGGAAFLAFGRGDRSGERAAATSSATATGLASSGAESAPSPTAAASPVVPKTTPTNAPTRGVAPGPSPAPSPIPTNSSKTAPPEPSGERYGGRTATLQGSSFGPIAADQMRAAFGRAAGAINACYASTEREAPDHQRMTWTLVVDATGAVKRAPPAAPFGRHAKLDACMGNALRTLALPATASGGEIASSASPTN